MKDLTIRSVRNGFIVSENTNGEGFIADQWVAADAKQLVGVIYKLATGEEYWVKPTVEVKPNPKEFHHEVYQSADVPTNAFGLRDSADESGPWSYSDTHTWTDPSSYSSSYSGTNARAHTCSACGYAHSDPSTYSGSHTCPACGNPRAYPDTKP